MLGLLGLAVGLTSLAYPYGRDQGLYGYIGREWLAGRVPYQSTFDVKTPGIFFVNLLAFALFGESMRAIRIFELAFAILPTGILAAFAATERARLPSVRHVGLGVFASCILYFGTLDFWNTAQCECWCAVFVMGAVATALRSGTGPALGRSAVVGALAATAVIFKPPCMWLALVPCAVRLHHARVGAGRFRGPVLSALALAAGGLVPITALFGYFRAVHALDDMVNLYVVMSRFYVVAGRSVQSVGQGVMATLYGLQLFAAFLLPTAGFVAHGAARAHRANDRVTLERYVVVVAAALGVVAMVVSQLKFFSYHWGAMPSVLAFAVCVLVVDAEQHVAAARRSLPLRGAATALVVACLASGAQGTSSLLVARREYYAFVKNDRASVDDLFVFPWFYSWPDTKRVASYLEAISTPDDRIAIRGFEPQMYIWAHRRYEGRFFWTTFLTDRRYHPEPEQLAHEDWLSFAAAPPRFVATAVDGTDPILDPTSYERIGYVRIATFEHYVVLERGDHLDFSTEVW